MQQQQLTIEQSRRKSASPATTVKSPCIKRCDEAPVTLHGWLFKQGSDGLMLWKKRWFVLSEYCLFYYKGPDEDKVLGSILLPSYTICPLSKDDGVYRKYAFKAEHANMRTYYFAAETKDSMIQWMNSLSLASILQNENILRPEMLSRQMARQGRSGRPNQPFHPVGHQPNGVQQMSHPQFNQSYDSSGSMLLSPETETRQPLYANAPPKPKRLNTSRDYSPSPEPSPDKSGQQQHFQYPETQGEIPHHERDRSEDPSQLRHRLPQERRTPEAYGRSNVKHRVPKDYEEVYNNSFGESDRNSINSRRYSEEIIKYNRDSYASNQVHHNRRTSTANYATDRELAEADMHAGHQSRQLSRNQHHPQHQDYQHSPQRPQSEYYPANHGLPQHNGHIPRNASHHEGSTNPRVPRPHSADFLEYEKRNGPLPAQEINSQARHDGKKIQPPRPKSTIGSPLRKPDDFWSEEVYAQKMRESAFMYDQSGSRSQSRASHRPPIPRSSTAPLSGPLFKEEKQPPTNHGRANSSVPDENMPPLQISPDRNSVHTEQSPRFPQQLTPPIYYQDKSPSSQTQYLPANHQHQSPNGEVAQLTNAQYYSPNQSFGSSVHPPTSPYHVNSNNQPTLPHHQQMSPQNQQFNHKLPLQQMSPQQMQQLHYQQQMMQAHKKASTYHHQMSPQQLQFSPHQQKMSPHNQQPMSPHNQQMSPHHPQLPQHHMQMNHHQQPQADQYGQEIAKYEKHNNQTVPQPMPSSHVQHVVSQQLPNNQFQSPSHHQHGGDPSPMHHYQENNLFAGNDPKITTPPSIPQPTPRKQNNHTPTMYQNIPPNSVAAKTQSDPHHGPGSSRIETATPNRLSEKFDSDRSNDSDFRRSSSARLPKHKTRMTQEESDEGKQPQTSDQVCREESMKRLLEWKQRMLQSPLTRKTSRNTSRTQTPTNSDSPVPSLHNDYIRQRVLEELNNQPDSAPNQTPKERERRLSRKGSSGSRSSRSRSSPRIAASKGNSYSSDEEGNHL